MFVFLFQVNKNEGFVYCEQDTSLLRLMYVFPLFLMTKKPLGHYRQKSIIKTPSSRILYWRQNRKTTKSWSSQT